MTNLGTALSLPKRSRTILGHLEARGSISPMEALMTYGNMRLAAAIFEIRGAGIDVRTDLKQDESGHKYARYSLVKQTRN